MRLRRLAMSGFGVCSARAEAPSERQAPSSRIPEGDPMQPNILFIFPDQWRGDWLGAVSPDLPVRTPNIDALLSRGTGFAKAWTPSPLCAPARWCLATGLAYGRAPVAHNSDPGPLDVPTLYQHLADAGYQVANFGKSDLLKYGAQWGASGRHLVDGEDRMARLGFAFGSDSAGKHDGVKAARKGQSEPYTDMLRQVGKLEGYTADMTARSAIPENIRTLGENLVEKAVMPPDAYANTAPAAVPDELYIDNVIGQATLEQLREFDPEKPWFAMVNFGGPHEPMDVTQSMIDRWSDVTFPLPEGADNQELHQHIRRRYASMIELIDCWVGRFVEFLRQSGALANTVIVFSSDHGEMLGERRLWQKQVPFEPSLHVPLIVAGPGVPSIGMTCGEPVSLLDLPPTLLSMSGAQPLPETDGKDLLDRLQERAAQGSVHAASGLGAWRAITDGRYKLVVGLDLSVPQGKLQFGTFDVASLREGLLYDLEVDPLEERNLWDAKPDVRDSLLRELISYYRLSVPDSLADLQADTRFRSQARMS